MVSKSVHLEEIGSPAISYFPTFSHAPIATLTCGLRLLLRDGRMKGSRFSEEQIIGVLRENEAGAKTEEVCRRHGISSATFYKWKA